MGGRLITADESAEIVVPCSPLDHLNYRGHFNTLLLYPMPSQSPDTLSACTSALTSAFDTVAASIPLTTGHIRPSPTTNHLEIAYSKATPMGSRIRFSNLISNRGAFPYTYAQLKEAGVPPSVWKPELFAPIENRGLSIEEAIEKGEPGLQTFGAQVTFIEGALVLALMMHHRVRDMGGLMRNFGMALKKGLEEVAIGKIGMMQKMGRRLDAVAGMMGVGREALQSQGLVAAVNKVRSAGSAAGKIKPPNEQDGLRLSIAVTAENNRHLLTGTDIPIGVTVVPNANKTPFPQAPAQSPGHQIPSRPYRSTVPTSAIFAFSPERIKSIKQRIQSILRDSPKTYMSPDERNANLIDKITSTTVLAALFWTHITEARSTRPGDTWSGPSINIESTSTFMTVCDVRGRLNLPTDYIGNAVYGARARLPVKKLQGKLGTPNESQGFPTASSVHTGTGSGDAMISAAVFARACIAIVASIHFLGAEELNKALAYISTLRPAESNLAYDETLDFKNGTDIYLTSWSRLGMTALEIPGVMSKTPEFSRKMAGKNDGAMIILPRLHDAHDWEVQVDLRSDDMGRLKAELSRYTSRVVDEGHLAIF